MRHSRAIADWLFERLRLDAAWWGPAGANCALGAVLLGQEQDVRAGQTSRSRLRWPRVRDGRVRTRMAPQQDALARVCLELEIPAGGSVRPEHGRESQPAQHTAYGAKASKCNIDGNESRSGGS
jgi:hypothetical protein